MQTICLSLFVLGAAALLVTGLLALFQGLIRRDDDDACRAFVAFIMALVFTFIAGFCQFLVKEPAPTVIHDNPKKCVDMAFDLSRSMRHPTCENGSRMDRHADGRWVYCICPK